MSKFFDPQFGIFHKRNLDVVKVKKAKQIEKKPRKKFKEIPFIAWFRRNARNILPTSLLVIWCLTGAGVMIAIDKAKPPDGISPSPGCIGNKSYIFALSLTQAISTTVGYGNLYPCNMEGRAFLVIFLLIALPLNVVVLEQLGKVITNVLHYVWPRLRYFGTCCKRRLKRDAKIAFGSQTDISIPLSVAIFLSLAWLVITAIYFYSTNVMDYSTALYFTIISLTTIGLGEITAEDPKYILANYVFIQVGLAMVSSFLQIISENIDTMVRNLMKQIEDDFKKEMIEEGYHRNISNDLVAEKAGWLAMFISERERENIQKEHVRRHNIRNVGVQCNIGYQRPTVSDLIVQTQQDYRRHPNHKYH